MIIPRTMSTQHPDNAAPAPFAEGDGVLKGDGEIDEALYAFDSLGCDEQMWDYEGKAADSDVVPKLLMRYSDYFRSHVLGRENFLTLRLPNPNAEHGMRKKVEEALHTIVTSYDIASSFYSFDAPPIFEVILPFTTSAEELVWIDSYYRDVVVGKQHHQLPGGLAVSKWLGEYRPEFVNVIPLLEDEPRIIEVDQLVERYFGLLDRDVSYLRVFLARSDPALNYGLIGAVLMSKIALQRLDKLEKKLGIPIYPIIGVGGAPFRGNFRPSRAVQCINEYPSVQTWTVQSSFKYDNSQDDVKRAIETVNRHRKDRPTPIDEERALDLLERTRQRYQEQISGLADLVNVVAPHVPRRRDRRLHIGLFGYSREAGEGDAKVSLPRAITFAAAMYSLGVPPEVLGMDILTREDIAFLKEVAPHVEEDLADACQFANEENIRKLLGRESVNTMGLFVRDVNREHNALTTFIYDWVEERFNPVHTRELVEWAAHSRGFLG